MNDVIFSKLIECFCTMQVFFTWLKETSLIYLSYQGEAYTEPYQTSKIEFFILDVRKNY